ncbi:hypothetical protein RC62_4188 [Flavobacterium aquidurense]|uniref:Uncharacterized protein n=1 Tax=Flavobacterium aquidurense TaxID=362413 RepID=A0A0Q0S5M3_9FLAO|nr:hypothetical protein RC62_4188 [Flavobacterium aquidurense]
MFGKRVNFRICFSILKGEVALFNSKNVILPFNIFSFQNNLKSKISNLKFE